MVLAFGKPAFATDPLPDDSVAIPVNVNLAVFNNEFVDTGAFGPRGGNVVHHTHLSYDVTVLRYVRAFDIDGVEFGAQAILPYLGYIGRQKVAGVDLSSASGFLQPYFGGFFWPINYPVTGTYLVIAPWVSPPIGNFNSNASLNPTAATPGDAWFEEIEAGLHKTLIGTPATQNLALEGWSTTYLYQSNPNFRVPTPFGKLDATYREQPTEEIRAYGIYMFSPATQGTATIGVFQSFGGKQTLNVPILAELGANPITDTSLRTDETQLRLAASSFVTPTMSVMAYGYYDVAAQGGVLTRLFGIRLTKFF